MTNTPARIDRLRKAIALIEGEGVFNLHGGTPLAMQAMIDLGARVTLAPRTRTLRYVGVTATWTRSDFAGLLLAWHAAALRKIARLQEES